MFVKFKKYKHTTNNYNLRWRVVFSSLNVHSRRQCWIRLSGLLVAVRGLSAASFNHLLQSYWHTCLFHCLFLTPYRTDYQYKQYIRFTRLFVARLTYSKPNETVITFINWWWRTSGSKMLKRMLQAQVFGTRRIERPSKRRIDDEEDPRPIGIEGRLSQLKKTPCLRLNFLKLGFQTIKICFSYFTSIRMGIFLWNYGCKNNINTCIVKASMFVMFIEAI